MPGKPKQSDPTNWAHPTGEETMQGSDYDLELVKMHESGWHNWTKFVLWSIISLAVLLFLMAAFLID
jgi:hypothetical protein